MTFCVIPWLHRQTDEQGFHQLCCLGVGPGNQLRDTEGRRMHISQRLTDEQVLNSPELKTARVQMVQGEWPKACERCRQSEQAGGVSVREQYNAGFAGHENLLRQTGQDGELLRPVVRFSDIRLGNACNLTCRMCNPGASRLWEPHYNVVRPPGYRMPSDQLQIIGENNWVKKESVSWLLEQSLPTLERLHFAGGEPLIIPELVDALEQCVASGRAGEIALSFNTNLTVLPDKVTSLWPRFRSVWLLCSVDGYGRTNEYIRRPSHWDDIDRNLRTLENRFDEWKIGYAAVSCVVQMYNALSVPDLYAYMRSAGFQRVMPIPGLVPLFDPHFLSIQGLPAHAKTVVRERLQAEIERAEAWNRPDLVALIGTIRATIAYMHAADATENLRDFFFFSEATDKAFGDSWREAAPELAASLQFLQPAPAAPLGA